MLLAMRILVALLAAGILLLSVARLACKERSEANLVGQGPASSGVAPDAGSAVLQESRLADSQRTGVGPPVEASVFIPAPVRWPAERSRLDLLVVARTPDGSPVPDASVRIVSTTGPIPRTYAMADDRAIDRHVRTDPDGRVHVRDLLSGPYLIDLRAQGDLVARRRLTLIHP